MTNSTKTFALDLSIPVVDTDLPCPLEHTARFTRRQSRALRHILDALLIEEELVQLTGPRPVKSPVDALRWILDRVADDLGLPHRK